MMEKKYVSKFVIIMLCFILSGCSWFSGCTWFEGCRSNQTSNEEAEEMKDERRYITIINNSNLIINSIEILVGEGIPVVKPIINPDDRAISIEVPETWKDYNSFHIIVMDVYDLHYEKTIDNVPTIGKTDVVISEEEDYVEYPGDWSRLLEKKLNEGK